MERAGRVLGQSKLSRSCASAEQIARSAWKAAVGKKLATHTSVLSLVRERLVIEVEDAIWQRQLFALRHQILKNVQKVVGPGLVEELEFRIRVPRFGPQPEPVAAPAADEADGIEDPMLRQLYVTARKKASA